MTTRNSLGASSETARFINCRLILNLIREKQPVSRADLARLTGLQRSTVSLATEDLIQQKWIVEGDAGKLPRGRRPTNLLLNRRRKILCVDVHPAKTWIGVSDINGSLEFLEAIPTHQDERRAIRDLVSRLTKIIGARKPGETFEGVGICLPGRVDPAGGKLVFAPNLKWKPVDIKTPVEQATGLETVLENAANSCALAEMWFSQDNGLTNLAAVAVAEGLGVGIIANGRLVKGETGMAGELGHFPLDPSGPVCGCGRRGCWETLASEGACLRYYSQKIDFKDLLVLAKNGDAKALRALHKMAAQLARGVRMIVAGLAPERIVFVGDFTAVWDVFEPVIQEQIRQQAINSQSIIVMPARNHENARLLGTVALVLQKHFKAD